MSITLDQSRPISCFGETDALLEINIPEGTPPFTYYWNHDPANNSAEAENVGPASYTATVTDNNGCSDSASIQVSEPAPLTVSCDSTLNNIVPRGREGRLFGTLSGGTGPFTIYLTGPILDSLSIPTPDSFSFSGLPEGDYQFLVVDAFGCAADCFSSVMAPPCDIKLSPTVTLPVCAGDSNGLISLTISGGSMPYLIDWSQNSFDGITRADNLPAGSINVSVTGANGCTQDSVFTLSEVNPLALSCANQSDSARLEISGGEGPYTIIIQGPQSDSLTVNTEGLFFIPSLPTGDYTIDLTDSRGCHTSCIVFIPDPNCTLEVESIAADETCPDSGDGQIALTILGADGVPIISWNDGNTAASRNDLSPGNYQVQVTDNLGCKQVRSFRLGTTFQPPTYQLATSDSPICANTCDSIYLVANGLAPYSLDLLLVDGTDSIVTSVSTMSDSIQLPLCPPNSIYAGSEVLFSVTRFEDAHCPATNRQSLSKSIVALDTQQVTPILCPEDSVIIAGVTFDQLRRHDLITLPGAAQSGCDSFLMVNLEFYPTDTLTFSPTLCWADSFLLQGELFNRFRPEGLVNFPNQTVNGCDSVVFVRSVILPEKRDTVSPLLCRSDTVMVAGAPYFFGESQGTEVINNVGPSGCDSTIVVDLRFETVDTTVIDTTLCAGRSMVVQETIYDQDNPTGIEVFPGATRNGCDSTVRITITTLPNISVSFRPQLCPGDTLFLDGQFFTENQTTGLVVLPNLASNGCDSLISVTVQYAALADTTINPVVCREDSLVAGTQTYSFDRPQGSEVLLGGSTAGCDSLLNIDLQFFPETRFNLMGTQCASDSVLLGDQIFTMTNPSGLVRFPNANQYGCDSLIDVSFTFLPPAIGTIQDTLCFGDSLLVGDQWFTADRPEGEVVLGNSSARLCDSIVLVDLFFRDPLLVTPTAQPTGCLGDEFSITLSMSQPTLTLNWASNWSGLGNSFTQTEQEKTYTFLPIPGDSLRLVSIEDAATGCRQNTALVITPLVSQLEASLVSERDYNGSSVSCTGADDGSIRLQIEGGVPPLDIQWENPGITGTNPNNLSAGSYQVTITDALGCSDSTSITLSEPSPLLVSTETIAPTCPEEPTGMILFENISGGTAPYTYQLVPDHTTAQPLTDAISGLRSGAYTLLINDRNNCFLSLPVAIPEAPGQFIDLPSEIEINLGDSVRLDPKITFAPVAFAWTSQPPLDIPQVATPVVQPLQSTTINLTAVDTTGCSVEGWVRIIVNRQLRVFAPSAFRPSGSGTNSRFMLFGGNIIDRIERLVIFDRWGQLMYEIKDVGPNDWQSGWDGTRNGQDAPAGVYVYTATVILTDGRTERLAGDLSLIR